MTYILNFISVFLVPFVIFYIVGYGILQNRPVFRDFTEGGKNGFEIVVQIAPTIIGLFVAVGIIRNSGALDLLCIWLAPLAEILHIPTQLLPISIIKMLSSSSANGFLFDLFKEYGVDSFVGMSASILLSCTETLFYTVSVYFMSIGIRKTKWVIPVGIFVMFLSILVSIGIAGCIM